LNSKLLFFLFSLFFCQLGWTASVEELQELNLAKAELALVDGNQKKAFKIIQRNLIKKHFHLASYQFLIDLYLKNEKYSKAFKVYYFLIKRLHSNRILIAGDRKALNFAYKKAPKPKPEALSLYEEIARKYFELHEREIFKNKRRPLFMLNMATKYFEVLIHYKYNIGEARYYLGLINKSKKNYGEAITNFLEARDVFAKEQGTEGVTQELDFLVGDTLIQTGLTDAGSLFLQSVYLRGTKGSSLRDYAQQYIESLYSQDLFIYSLSYGMTRKGNAHSLSDEEIESFDADFKESLGSVSDTSQDLTLSAFYNSKQQNHFQYIASAYYATNEHSENLVSIQDSQAYGVSAELRYDNLIKSLVRLSYSLGKVSTRPEAGAAYESLSTSHTFTLSYGHLLKSGLITYRIPFSFTSVSSENSNDTSYFGLNLSFVPYTNTKYFKPSYTLVVNSNNEGEEGISRSLEINPSITNHFQIDDYRSIFLTGGFTYYRNSDETYGYKEWEIDASYAHVFKFWTNLNGSLSYSYTSQSQDDDDSVGRSEISGNLSVSF
jgi:hypothetical protein